MSSGRFFVYLRFLEGAAIPRLPSFIIMSFSDNWKRTFLIIWTGQFLSLLSSSLVNFAIIIWLSLETGSAEVLAFAAMAALLPQSLIGSFAGVYIDRWDRKRTMIMADSFIALCTLLIFSVLSTGQAGL